MKCSVVFIQNVSINDHRMVHINGVAKELLKRGYNVDVVIRESNEEPQFKDLPYKVICIPGNTYSILGQVKFIYGICKLFRNQKYDIIHAKNPFSSILPALLCRSGARMVYDMRGLWIDFGIHSGDIPSFMASLLWKIDLWCMRKSDRVIAISHELKKELVKRGLEEDHVEVIVGSGVAFEEIQEMEPKDIREYLGFEGGVVGYVGGIGRSRYSERIIEAFKYVHDEIESAKLVMIGPYREDEYFSMLVKELGLGGYVFFTGYIPHDEALKFMKFFDVAVSYHEGDLPIFNVAVPTKILEYLATGCSIVTTDQKMYQNLLTHKEDGYLTFQNSESFAEGIIHVLENEELSKNISKNALLKAEKLSFENVTDKIEKVYESIR